jgi:hypothetical protein
MNSASETIARVAPVRFEPRSLGAETLLREALLRETLLRETLLRSFVRADDMGAVPLGSC